MCYVCVCVLSSQFILDVKFIGSTSRRHTRFLIHLPSAVLALIFLARRIQPFLSLVNREVEFLCNDLIVLHLLGIFIFISYIISEEKPQLPEFELTSQCVRRLRDYQMSYREKNKTKIKQKNKTKK